MHTMQSVDARFVCSPVANTLTLAIELYFNRNHVKQFNKVIANFGRNNDSSEQETKTIYARN